MKLSKDRITIPQQVVDGRNDSSGIKWVKVSDLTINNASPLVMKVVEEIQEAVTIFEKSLYPSWQVL